MNYLPRLALWLGLLLPCLPAAAWQLDAPRATAETWGYRPVDRQTSVNPPGFTWGPEKGATAYHVQVAKDAAFAEVVYEIAEHPWSSLGPEQPLPVNVPLHWRYRAQHTENGWSDWSETREFSVAPDAVAFPKPTKADLIAKIPAEHPRLFMRPDTVEELKTKIAGPLSAHWADALAQADKVLADPPPSAEPPLYPEGIKIKGEEWKKIWWGNRVYSFKLMEDAAKCAFAWRLSGDEKYGAMAHDLLMAFAAWDPKGSTQYNYNDEAAMPLLYWPSRAYTWAYDRFTPEEREKIAAVMHVRGQDCFNHLKGRDHVWRPYASHSNRAWHKLAELAITFHDVIPEAADWLDYAMTIFYTCYPVWGGPDGGWHEGIGYWVSYLERFNYSAVTFKTALGIDAYQKPFFAQTGYYGMYTLPPGAEHGAWGDLAQRKTSKQIATYMGHLAAATGNKDFKWYAQQHGFDLSKQGWFGVVTASLQTEQVAAEAPANLPPSRVFPDTGLAVFNTNLLDSKDNVQVHFKSSLWGTQSHGYNANNSFMLYVNGEPLLTLTGMRDVYGSPHHSQWMWESKSDNAILFNGEGQIKHSAKALGRISHNEHREGVDVVVGEAGDSYRDLKRWTRRLFFFKPNLLLIHDILEAKEPGAYQWLLHAPADFSIEGNEARIDQGKFDTRAMFLFPDKVSFSQTDQFDPPPHDWSDIQLQQFHLTAEASSDATGMEFLVPILVGLESEPGTEVWLEPNDEPGTRLVEVNQDGKTYRLQLRRDGYEWKE